MCVFRMYHAFSKLQYVLELLLAVACNSTELLLAAPIELVVLAVACNSIELLLAASIELVLAVFCKAALPIFPKHTHIASVKKEAGPHCFTEGLC